MFSGTDRFRVQRVLGEGSHGVVYEVLDAESGTLLALKTLRTLSADELADFKQEFRSIQDLSHPNLVELFDLQVTADTWFFTMQLVEGVNFLEYVRPASRMLAETQETRRLATPPPIPAPDDEPQPYWPNVAGALEVPRLTACLIQLVRGLMALHDAGKVHRDVKPSNTRVTVDGRLVLLDFGLAKEVRHREKDQSDIIGTVAYMAPEQAAGTQVTAAADWYSLGVMLFEALTGRVPFYGSAVRVLLDKQHRDAPDPRTLEPDVPAALADLTVALLDRSPSRRPTGLQILQRLEARPTFEPLLSTGSKGIFVGRAQELDLIHRAYDEARERPRVVCFAGPSGMGKTTLIREALRSLERRAPPPLVLEGACYQRESVPYKGIDGALDTLASTLTLADWPWVRRCVPPDAELLTRFFPVLARISPLAEARRATSGTESADPSTLRHRLFAALGTFLQNLTAARPVVLVLDDIQWAGDDTWALLKQLFRGATAPRLLLLTAARLEDADPDSLRQRHEDLVAAHVTWANLAPLTGEESLHLATTLLERLGAPSDRAPHLVVESRGAPLLLDAYARAHQTGGEASLDDMLMQRVRGLDPLAQRVLEYCALSNTPIVQQAVARASELDFGQFIAQVAALKLTRLVQTSGTRALDTIQPFHDRLRQAVLRTLNVELQQAMQLRLAVALETATVPDSEALAWHWAQAGDALRAAQHAERAAGEAMNRLAFERAATFYQQAVEAAPDEPRLLVKLGEALAGAGRGGEAALAFERASVVAPPLEGLELTRRSAHEFLRAGKLERGLERIEAVLRASGERPVPSALRGVLSVLYHRLVLFVRGLGFVERSSKDLRASTLLRIDATWSAAEVLSMLDVVQGAAMQLRNLLSALKAGEPMRVARAMAMQAGVIAASGRAAEGRARAMHRRAAALAQKLQDGPTSALVHALDGIIEFLVGGIERSHAILPEAVRAMHLDSRGSRFELTNANLFLLIAQFYLGELKEFLLRLPELRDEAQRRGDLYALTNFTVNQCNLYWLALDQPDVALRNVDEALRAWEVKGYQTLHYYGMLARAQVALYTGRPEDAARLVHGDWPKMKSNFLLTAQMLRIEAWHLRGRVACATADLSDLRRVRAQLHREQHPFATALAATLDEGQQESARWTADQWAAYEQTLQRGQLLLHLRASRLRRKSPDAEAWWQSTGVLRPAAFVDMLIPRWPGQPVRPDLASDGVRPSPN